MGEGGGTEGGAVGTRGPRSTLIQRRGVLPSALALLSLALMAPYLVGGPGFFMDDWAILGRVETEGVLRAATWGRLASRPGAWVVYTVFYGGLRDHIWAWMVVMAALGAAIAVLSFWVLARFTTRSVAAVVVAVWIVLPNHQSVRLWTADAHLAVSVVLFLVAVLLADDGRLVAAGLVLAAATTCYELVLVPGVVILVALHVWRGAGSRRQLLWALGIVGATVGAMLVRPTYSLGASSGGSWSFVLPGHFSTGIGLDGPAAALLVAVVVAGVVAAGASFRRGDREVGSAPWLVGAGICLFLTGIAATAFKVAQGDRGMPDRVFTVSSMGVAMVLVGSAWALAQFVPGRWRTPVLAGVGAAFALTMVTVNVEFQRDWSGSARDGVDLLHAVDQRYAGRPPPGLVVGPSAPYRAGVQSLHDLYIADASRVVLGRPMVFTLAEEPSQYDDSPAERRASVESLIGPR